MRRELAHLTARTHFRAPRGKVPAVSGPGSFGRRDLATWASEHDKGREDRGLDGGGCTCSRLGLAFAGGGTCRRLPYRQEICATAHAKVERAREREQKKEEGRR